MKIAIFSDTFTPEVNGVALTLKRYTDYLETQGVDYRLFVPDTNTPVPNVPQVERLTSIPFLLYRDLRFTFPNPVQIKHVLNLFRPDLLHIATPFNLGLSGVHFGKKYDIPMIASYHTHFDDYLEYYHLSLLKKWIWKYMEWFHRSMERVYVPSVSTKEKLLERQIHPDIDIWGRGVNHEMFSPDKKEKDFFQKKYGITEKKIILYVGRIAPEKNINVVLDTFHALAEPVKKDTHLVIAGDGPLGEELAGEYHHKITWTGFLKGEELARAYASSDVFLFPSPTETFGNVVLEALASGLPVIGANAGGVANLIDNGKNGYLCGPKNSHDFARKVESVLDNKYMQQQLSIEARTGAIALSWDKIFSQLFESFDNVLRRKKELSAIA
jgi:glycosyltransferase involved in cell wall biosynthesis